MSERLQDKVAIITGGASGVGEGGTRAFAEAGAIVVIADLNQERGEALAGELREVDGRAIAVRTDVTESDSVATLVAEVVDRFGRVDALFHCAADARFINSSDRRITELPEETWTRMIDLLLTGTFRVLKAVGRQMIAQGHGSIILCGTADAIIGIDGFDSYVAAKGGVLSLTRSAAVGLAKDGIRVNMVCPSFVDTEAQQEWMDGEQGRAAIERMHLLGLPEPIDIGRFAAFLASSEARFVTGGIFPVDSGYLAFKAKQDVVEAMGEYRPTSDAQGD